MAETTCDAIARVHLRPLDSLGDADRCRVLARECWEDARNAERAGLRLAADASARAAAFWEMRAEDYERGGAG